MRNWAIFLILSIFLMSCEPASGAKTIRVATFNIAMGLAEEGALSEALASGEDLKLQQVAEILQRVRPDIVLLNEFDFDPAVDAAALFNENYLGNRYPYSFRAPVNTGVDSGMDLDGDGETGGPGDAWGFGHFPGQYSMLVLSRFPIDTASSRTFQNFLWSELPAARRPMNTDGTPFYPDGVWKQLRLSSKSHWDVVIEISEQRLHLLAHHPTPPVFDGPENRNGLRNFDEIRFWREYTNPAGADFIVDDQGLGGGLSPGLPFIIAGDFNADPHDGDSHENAIGQLLQADWINSECVPASTGGLAAAERQGGVNRKQQGDPAADTADFNDLRTGNLRLDYLLPSSTLSIEDCGVFWPASGEDGAGLVEVSDHRLVWLDVSL